MKSKSKNYVLTDLGLVPEHVDREAGFDSEKYKDMLRKIEKQYGEKKKVKQEVRFLLYDWYWYYVSLKVHQIYN